MKQQVSHRLDAELLAWAGEYAAERGSSRSAVIEEGLRHFLELSRGGVPDLPVEQAAPVAAVRPSPGRTGMTPRSVQMAREMGWMT